MDCKKIEQVIFRFLYGEANIEELRHIKEHLDRCGHCRRESEIIALILSQLKDSMTPEPVPEGLKERVLAKIRSNTD
jgi:mycothiol system anti-sigma-R factor